MNPFDDVDLLTNQNNGHKFRQNCTENIALKIAFFPPKLTQHEKPLKKMSKSSHLGGTRPWCPFI